MMSHSQAKLTSHVIIPARLASTRLPRKLLLRETGKSVLQHTYEGACRAARPHGVLIAVDHAELADEAERFGAPYLMTDPEAASGTDRVAEAARKLQAVDLVVNVQGDEPEIAGSSIDLVIELLEQNPSAVMATLATPIRKREALHDPACVKVVCDQHARALYFSRSPIPHAREWHDRLLEAEPPLFLQHIGLYAYRRDFLMKLAQLPPSRLEQVERLEQLRVLEAGETILVGRIDDPTVGVDTPADYQAFVQRMLKRA